MQLDNGELSYDTDPDSRDRMWGGVRCPDELDDWGEDYEEHDDERWD